MAEQNRIGIAALNISASPHPSGIYRQILLAASEIEVPVWGSDWALITSPQTVKGHEEWLGGRVLLWTKIDRDGKWLNKTKKIEATREETKKVADAIPADFEPNYRSFNYVFVEAKHRLILEVENELGQRFGPSRAERFFSRLLSPDYLPKTMPLVDVTVIPEEETLARILAMPRLRRLEIVIKRPNPDVSGASYQEVMDELTEQGARIQKMELQKAPKVKAIIPNARTQSLAGIAATNGYVSGEGRDPKGKPTFESTRDHPMVRFRDITTDSSLEMLYASTRLFL